MITDLHKFSFSWSILQHIGHYYSCVSTGKMWVVTAPTHSNSKPIVRHLTAFRHSTTHIYQTTKRSISITVHTDNLLRIKWRKTSKGTGVFTYTPKLSCQWGSQIFLFYYQHSFSAMSIWHLGVQHLASKTICSSNAQRFSLWCSPFGEHA